MEYIERYGSRVPQKKHGALTVVLVILVILLAAAAIVSWLALSDPYAGRGLENIRPSDSLQQTFLKSALKKDESSFSKDEVNGYLAYLFQKNEVGKRTGTLQPQAIAVADASGGNADFYIPVVFRGKRLGVSLNVTPSLDASASRLLFRVNSVRVGRLSVPVGWALKKADGHFPKGFSRDGNTVFCAAPALKASVGSVSVSFGLGEFRLENGTLKLAGDAKININ